jgi:hypothetical protein
MCKSIRQEGIDPCLEKRKTIELKKTRRPRIVDKEFGFDVMWSRRRHGDWGDVSPVTQLVFPSTGLLSCNVGTRRT